MPKCTYYDFELARQLEFKSGSKATGATHLLKLYHLVAALKAPTVVEFGVRQGHSTCMLLNGVEESGGHLYSVDVNDCSDAAESDSWTFIQESDQEIEAILSKAPALKGGINLLHIDSIHTDKHVYGLLMKWFPYVEEGGLITFHDIDPIDYFKGQCMDNPKVEPDYIGLSNVVIEFYYANKDQTYLEYHFGSLGMGFMRKISPLHMRPNPPVSIRPRVISITPDVLYWTTRFHLIRLLRRLGLLKLLRRK